MHTSSRIIAVCLLIFSYLTPTYAASWEKIEINGYLSFEYENAFSGDNQGDPNGSFDMDLLDIVLNIQATDRLRIAADLTWEHGAATEDNRGNVAIEYAFAEYTYKDWLRFRAGKMFTAFGIYNEIHTAKPATLSVKEPLSTNKNNKFGSDIRFYPRWLNGLAIQGDVEISDMHLDYNFQLSNGETEEDVHNPFEEDDNTHKAVNGRIRLQTDDEIRLGFSFYSDSMEDKNSTNRLDILSYGLQFEMETDNGLSTEIEYVKGKEDRKASASIDRNAYSVMFYHSLNDWLIPYIRYEYLEPNEALSNDIATLGIIGINMLIDTNMHIKLEIDKTSTESGNTEFSGDDWTEFKASLSIGF
jgi:predicted porin